MLTVASLPARQLRARLAGPGIKFQTGPFIISIRTSIASVADGIALLYAEHRLHDDNAFADFDLELVRPRGLRHWLRPQVKFLSNSVSIFEPLPLAQAFPMFEWGMNWCISSRAHNHLIIHAAVVERNGLAAILPAPPGSGKSTLCAALVNHGWRLLSDELALVAVANGMLVPVPRPVSLKNASIAIVRDYVPGAALSPAVHDTNKGTVAHLRAPVDSVRRADQLAAPKWIIFPKYTAGAAPQLAPLRRIDAFQRLAENAFNYSVLGAGGFDTLAGVIARCDSFTFNYSRLDDALATFDSLSEQAA